MQSKIGEVTDEKERLQKKVEALKSNVVTKNKQIDEMTIRQNQLMTQLEIQQVNSSHQESGSTKTNVAAEEKIKALNKINTERMLNIEKLTEENFKRQKKYETLSNKNKVLTDDLHDEHLKMQDRIKEIADLHEKMHDIQERVVKLGTLNDQKAKVIEKYKNADKLKEQTISERDKKVDDYNKTIAALLKN